VIKTVWLDNPPVNAVDGAMVATLTEALVNLDADTRVVVLRGRGERAFSAGVDIAGFADPAASDEPSDEPPGGIQPAASLIDACPVPVVAAIHGYCLGGGLELALACDVRVAHADAWLGFPEVRLGLLPGGGGTQRLPRVVGPGRAAWLIMSGERIAARQAEAWGLLELVVDDLDAGIEHVAGTLAKQSPNALREIKALLRTTRDARSDDEELKAFQRCLRSEDGQEGVAAFLEKREPRWFGD
jgi:enoyl-CoA hydratase/carnithine racemase